MHHHLDTLEDEGYALNSEYTRYSVRLKLDHKPTDWLTIGGNMQFTGGQYINSSSSEGSMGHLGTYFALTNTTFQFMIFTLEILTET